MTTCPSSSRKSPPSCSGEPQISWPASRLKLGQLVETSSSSSSERGSRTSTSERSFTSRSSDIVILCAKQTLTILFYEIAGCATGSARFVSAHLHSELLSLYILGYPIVVVKISRLSKGEAGRISQENYLLKIFVRLETYTYRCMRTAHAYRRKPIDVSPRTTFTPSSRV